MLYLKGESGTMYEYIHLNNDLTAGNDNKGKCVQGVSYAVPDGAHVESGRARSATSATRATRTASIRTCTSRCTRTAARRVDPFPFLKKAPHLLVAAPPAGIAFTLKLTGTVVSADGAQLTMNVGSLAAWPSHVKQTKLNRDARDAAGDGSRPSTFTAGEKIVAWTLPAPGTVDAMTRRARRAGARPRAPR